MLHECGSKFLADIMYYFRNTSHVNAIKITLIFVLLHHVMTATRLHHSAIKGSCSKNLNYRAVLQVYNRVRGNTECVILCARNFNCELSVYEEFRDKSTSCTSMSEIRADMSEYVYTLSSKTCVAMFVIPCVNGGHVFEGVCICKDGFAGQACEYSNPRVCNVEWTQAASLSDGTLRYDLQILEDFSLTKPKISFRKPKLNVTFIMKGMNAGLDILPSSENLYFVTFPSFEKTDWNRFTDDHKRQFMHVLINGEFQLLSFNGTVNNYTFSKFTQDFIFITPKDTPFTVERTLPRDWALIQSELEGGYEIFRSTWTNLDDRNQVVVTQSTERTLSLKSGGHFSKPPMIFNAKSVLGQAEHTARFYMDKVKMYGTTSEKSIEAKYLNPCWTKIDSEQKDRSRTNKMLGTYLRLGNDVRVKTGTTFHTVLEVIQTGDIFTFLLAPFLSQTNTAAFTSTVHGVRSLVTSSGFYQSCTHDIEGEQVRSLKDDTASGPIVWFVDTRKWNKVFSVFSNSSVQYGSLSDLATGVTKGSDVRVWIRWLSSDLSRFLDTHMSSVTHNGKVSTESLVTWRTQIGTDSSIRLHSQCDLQYIQVTSDGMVEILTFNVWTPAQSEVHSDAIITWFLA